MKEKIVKFKGGGTLIYSRSKLNNCSAVEVGFSVGAFQEKKPGTAHFLEHTLFKKTTNRTNAELENDRTKIVFLNASTSMDYLLIKFFRSNKLINESMEFASDVLLNSVVDDEYVESEKGVVTEELVMCLDNESRDIYVKNYRQAQSKARFASDIVGRSEENIKKLKFSDIKKFKDKHFIANNFVASMVSSLSLHKCKKLIKQYFINKLKFDENYSKGKSYFETARIDKPSSLKIYKNSQDKVTMLLSFKINKNEIEIFGKNFNYLFLSKYFSGAQGELFSKLRNQGLIYRLDSDYSCFNKNNFDYLSDEKMPVKMTTTCHINLMDYFSFGEIFNLTNRQKNKLKNEVCSNEVANVAREIFNKQTSIFVTVLGNVTKKYVPTLDYFKKNFLIWE